MADNIIKSETNTESGNKSDSFEQALKLKLNSIIKSETNTKNGNKSDNSDNFEQALRLRFNSIMEQIRSIDSLITKVQEEFSRTLEELNSNKNTYEETLNHIQALLKIETNGLPPIVRPLEREELTFSEVTRPQK